MKRLACALALAGTLVGIPGVASAQTGQDCLVVPTINGDYWYCDNNNAQAAYTVDSGALGGEVWQGQMVTPHLSDIQPVYALQLAFSRGNDNRRMWVLEGAAPRCWTSTPGTSREIETSCDGWVSAGN